ncbi:MAG TPA: type II toxin-antitoxin system HicB family antitoxin [Stellaceae bacterium]|nr:type II toxin-antitoxin system HicB family antitoxin [Stellaceae bacterium]
MESNLCVWRARIKPDDDGRFLVTFPEFPEALTDGATEVEAMANATDALSEALMQRLKRNEVIPAPRHAARGEYQVAPEPIVAMKLALRAAVRDVRSPASELTRRLRIDEKEARRLLDPAFPSKAPRLAAALRAMDTVVTVGWFHAGKNERILANPAAKRRGATMRPKRAIKTSRQSRSLTSAE